MTEQSRKPTMANPFYVVLLVVSTSFVVTALAYLVGPYTQQAANGHSQPGSDSRLLADWLDRHGPMALGVEFALMFVSGLLAMATEQRFSPRRSSRSSGSPPVRT
jgi:hypothetical protein